MTLAERIAGLEARMTERMTARAALTTQINDLRQRFDAGDTTVTEESVRSILNNRGGLDAELRTLTEQRDALRSEVAADEAVARLQSEIHPGGGPAADQRNLPGEQTGGQQRTGAGYENQARVEREPAAYNAVNQREVSFFRDSFASQVGQAGREVQERLTKNEREVRAVMIEREQGGQLTRATTTGSYAGLVVPQYLVDDAVNVLRFGRPMAAACRQRPLLDQGMVFYLPRATTGVTAASQATENTAASNTDQVWNNTTIHVASIMGQQQISRQSLERGTPGIDGLIYEDLVAAYAAEQDRQIFVGSGASGQLDGINGTSGIYTAAAFGSLVTIPLLYGKTAGAIAAVAAAGTAVTPRMIVMHPRRWGYLTSIVDSSNRPLVVPDGGGGYNAYAINVNPGAYGGGTDVPPDTTFQGPIFVGNIQGMPVFTDANVPTTLGAGASEDFFLVFDPRHALLFEEGDGMPRQLMFEQIQASGVAGFGATVTMAVYGYSAFTAGRYPAAFARVGAADSTAGYGLQAPQYTGAA